MANCDRHPGVLVKTEFWVSGIRRCLLVKIVGENTWLVHTIRHLRRRCAHTIATQQEMEISLRLFPFPTVLSTIYRLRRIPFTGFPFPDFSDSRFRFPIYRLRRISDSRISGLLSLSDLLQIVFV